MSDKTKAKSSTGAALSLPEGGGAIKGIGETFQADLFSGTVVHGIPIALSPGRNSFGPQLSLEYSSGNGNGLFGLGWQLNLPRITRKTERGLPRYDDTDTFVMSGGEDLVRVPEGPQVRGEFAVFRYRPRTEGLFARIERWVHVETGEIHWRTITRDNVTSVFGATADSRLSDPLDSQRVFEWLLHESFDAFGNHSVCEYAADDPAIYTDLPDIFEQRRQATQRYIRRMYYGNLPADLSVTYADGSPIGHLRGTRRYAFEVVFDYGDWDSPSIVPHPQPWPLGTPEMFGADPATTTDRIPAIRPDRFSHFRAGFDIRTLRRCRRVLMFHHFAELGAPTLVRSTDFSYSLDPQTQMSLLSAVTLTGYERAGSSYQSAAIPAVKFSYTQFQPQGQRYQSLTAAGGEMPPLPLSDPNLALVDLFGDGLPDVLHTGPGGFRYWRNLGNGKLDRPRTLTHIPAGISLDQPGVGFGDMSGNGIADLMVTAGALPGFFETTVDGAWRRFTAYESAPGFDSQDPNLRMVDLTGDGRSDALVTTDEQFLWFPCLGEKGFSAPNAVARVHDLDEFPDVFFDDPSGRVHLADMTGDGLNDIVRVHDGRIEYWPNLGYGRFGKRVTMANSPRFASELSASFDPKRLFLADLNGTGCADLVYVDTRRVCFWFNQSGNGWSERQVIVGTPTTTAATAVEFADVFGTGTATLLWSRELDETRDGNYKALDFCGGRKPYILSTVDNGMGVTTRVSYAPSTRYFLEDRACGLDWITPLPFPVQVVERVESIDHISRAKRVSRYKYHHGHFDGREREFCGFGRVDQFDTETFEDFSQPGLHGSAIAFDGGSAAYHVPPVEKRTWFHMGIDSAEVSLDYREEYYDQDPQALPLDAHDVDDADTPNEAFRALRGAQLRTEIYSHDGSGKAHHPYQVEESRYQVTRLQAAAGHHRAIYFRRALESLTYHYERNPLDPRINHDLTLEVDAFGNELRSLSISYGRRQASNALPTPADQRRQTRTLITYQENRFTNAIDDVTSIPDSYHAPLPSENLSYELTGFVPETGTRFSHAEWVDADFARIANAEQIDYEQQATDDRPQKRVIEHERIYYRADNLRGLLPLGRLQSLALPGDSRKLAFTARLVVQLYGDRVNDTILQVCGYVRDDDQQTWWLPSSSKVSYSPGLMDTPADELAFARRHFFAVCRTRDVFGNSSLMVSDPYVLQGIETRDALDNRTLVQQDYRVLQPSLLIDPNGNRQQVAFDVLGMVVGTAVMGKEEEALGDSLRDFLPNLTSEQRQAFLANPVAQSAELLASASTRIVYDLYRFQREGQPVCAVSIAREMHVSDGAPAEGLRVQLRLSYSDGSGREIQQKRLADAGSSDPTQGIPRPHRWIGSGWTVLNNKGKAVKQFEPFFDDTHEFRFDRRVGVSSTSFYDPLDRLVGTLHPDHTWEKVVFDPWRRIEWGVNDTVLIADPRLDANVGSFFQQLDAGEFVPSWYEQRSNGGLGEAQQEAARKAAVHAGTPPIAHFDALGRMFLTIAHNRFERNGVPVEEFLESRVELDIEGNEREVIDASGRIVMRYQYDMLGLCAHQVHMEAGERWLLDNVGGQPAFAWNGRGHQLRTTYDELRRPVEVLLREGAEAERVVTRTIYGEGTLTPHVCNLRGKVYQQLDQAGVLTSAAYDFKGNLLTGRRQLAREYKAAVDWSVTVELESEIYVSSTSYDALNRPVALVTPDGSITRPRFNAGGSLLKVDVQLGSVATAAPFITHVDYDAKGQRTEIVYGNGLRTRYAYDPLTLRLTSCQTSRGSERLQDLYYIYDPTGNIVRIQDDAQQTLYFANQVVPPTSKYTYDALSRLIAAEGREHIGQVSRPETTWNDAWRINLQHPHDGQAMRRYTEGYVYDAVGTLLEHNHSAANGSWTRTFVHRAASLIEPEKFNSRLGESRTGTRSIETYSYDAHGNMISMPHLAGMSWDFRDQLQRVDISDGVTAYYVYDSSGQRLRKVIEKNREALIEERVTLGNYEVFRRRNINGVMSNRETLHVMDDRQRVALVETAVETDDDEQRSIVAASVIRYQFGNHLGSAALEVDAAGQIISYEEYYPYGSTSYQAGRTAAEVSLKRYRYTGMERDEETGLNCHGARYYAPWLGQWISTDPIGLCGGSPNLYLYAAANPIALIDPSGAAPKRYEKQRGKDTANKEKQMKANLKKAKSKGHTPDPMQKRAEKVTKKRGKTPIEHHHHKGVRQAADVKLAPGKMGDQMSSVWSTLSHDPNMKAGVGDLPVWDENFAASGGVKRTHHNAAAYIDKYEQARLPKSAQSLQEAGELSKWRWPATADMTERASMDWTRTVERGPTQGFKPGQIHPQTGAVTPHSMPTKKGRAGGLVGKAISVGIAGFVLFKTGDVYAAAQTANPLASTTDVAFSEQPTISDFAVGVANDAYGLTPLATIDWVVFDLMGPQGEFRYDPKLASRAIQEARNPFCAQCHGPGGALDPNVQSNRMRALQIPFQHISVR